MPFEPMPASVRPRCMRVVGAAGELLIDGDQVLHGRDLGRQDDPVLGRGRSPPRGRPRAAPTARSPRGSPSACRAGFARRAFSFIRWVSSSWSSEPQLAPMRTGLS